MTVVRIKEYFLLFFRAGHTVISRSYKKYKPIFRGQRIGREPEREFTVSRSLGYGIRGNGDMLS